MCVPRLSRALITAFALLVVTTVSPYTVYASIQSGFSPSEHASYYKRSLHSWIKHRETGMTGHQRRPDKNEQHQPDPVAAMQTQVIERAPLKRWPAWDDYSNTELIVGRWWSAIVTVHFPSDNGPERATIITCSPSLGLLAGRLDGPGVEALHPRHFPRIDDRRFRACTQRLRRSTRLHAEFHEYPHRIYYVGPHFGPDVPRVVRKAYAGQADAFQAMDFSAVEVHTIPHERPLQLRVGVNAHEGGHPVNPATGFLTMTGHPDVLHAGKRLMVVLNGHRIDTPLEVSRERVRSRHRHGAP